MGTARPTPCGCSPLSSDRGFTLIELVVVICIVGVLAGTLLNRVWFYQEQAEKAAMEQVASALQSALTLKYGGFLASGSTKDISALILENPMNWLAKVPRNYAGEYYGLSPRTVAPGNWAFDLKTRNLVYVVDRSEHFTPGSDGHRWVRYKVTLLEDALPGPSGKRGKMVAGALFDPVEPYRWLEQ